MVCGSMVVAGFYTRLTSTLLLIDISVALLVSKFPILFGTGSGPFEVRELNCYGIWAFMYEFHTGISMFIGTIFLLIKGGGK